MILQQFTKLLLYLDLFKNLKKMGTWIGHVAPAIFFICISTWWAFVTSYRYIRSKKFKNGKKEIYEYRGSLTMPCSFCKCGRRFPVESFIKFVGLFTEVIAEIILGIKYIGDKPV